MIVSAPVQRRIDIAAIDSVIAWHLYLTAVDLAHDQPFQRGLHCCQPPKRKLHCRVLSRVVGIREFSRDAYNKLELLEEPHIGLMVCHRVTRRAHVDGARHINVVVAEYSLPWHCNVLEPNGAI